MRPRGSPCGVSFCARRHSPLPSHTLHTPGAEGRGTQTEAHHRRERSTHVATGTRCCAELAPVKLYAWLTRKGLASSCMQSVTSSCARRGARARLMSPAGCVPGLLCHEPHTVNALPLHKPRGLHTQCSVGNIRIFLRHQPRTAGHHHQRPPHLARILPGPALKRS